MSDESVKHDTVLPISSSNLVEAMPPLKLRRWRFVLVGAIAILALLSLTITNQKKDIQKTSPVRIIPVKAQPIEAVKSYQVLQTYTGEVAALRASELGFERSGRVVKLNVDRGDRVVEGTALAKLDISNLETQLQELLARKAQAVAVLEELKAGPRIEKIAAARAQVKQLEELLKLDEIKRSRRQDLYTQGAISREQYDEVAFNANALTQRLAVARSELDELLAGTRKEQIAAQQAAVKQLDASIAEVKVNIAKSTIKAPYSGIIAARRLDEGTVVNASQSVLRLVENANPEVEIGVPVQLTPQIQPGSQQKVQVGQTMYRGRVVSILPEVNPTTRTRTIVLKLENSIAQSVAPGQIARLAIPQTISTNGYWLPIAALVKGERGLWSCYALATEKNSQDKTQSYRVEQRNVEVLHTQGNRVLVRGTLLASDMVIVDGTQRIVPGQLVQISD
ncbi:efflux RND transporter periplasmic adaptor subunit [Scytonema sp. UIC 10036]|uniref:efflux RND transporter periplasmic adaptor subunit n=1 Tax=Scytonema sp. UIC 10036 TaxID=2304196 RepID=UPI0012DA87D4|nr:efflux RND transporter periplasmic adaptor subunit [Scytonema sp. UIC 10036]MUH00466.1 efflux RND transporter periplasmic adaptor subunit [Scytonema sp. UIC 10036]